MEKYKKNKGGITLIALIITIIVMLILVSVTINIAVNGRLFNYAREAGVKTNKAKDEEQDIADLEPGMTTDELVFKYTTAEYSKELLNENGVLTQNAKHTDINKKTAVIPKGFGIVKGCEIIDNGLVIADKFDNEGNSIGNEFVWIPVPKDTFIRTWFYNNYTFEEIAQSSDQTLRSQFFNIYKNQDSRLNYNTWSLAIENNTDIESWEDIVYIVKTNIMADLLESADNDPTGKYDEMVTSVAKYGGFYIGRYETGEKENDKLVVQRDKKPYGNIKWGEYNDGVTSVGTSGIVYLCGKMYEDSDSVVSTLCYGIQWDSMLRFIKDSTHDVNISTDWGNYYNSTYTITRRTAQYNGTPVNADFQKTSGDSVVLTTGASDDFKAKNIYDVAGNLFEWTMEADSSSNRVMRGGIHYNNGANSPASDRSTKSPTHTYGGYGFRVALYVY